MLKLKNFKRPRKNIKNLMKLKKVSSVKIAALSFDDQKRIASFVVLLATTDKQIARIRGPSKNRKKNIYKQHRKITLKIISNPKDRGSQVCGPCFYS